VQPSLDDIEAFIAPFRGLPEVERQTHFEMPTSTDEAEMNDDLSMLARESSDSARTELMVVGIGQNLGEDEEIQKPKGARRKRSHRTNHPTMPDEEKKRKKRLRRLSCLEQDAGPSTSLLGDGPVSTTLKDDVRGCDDARVGGCMLDEDEEEEKEEIPLIRKNNRRSRSSDIPMQALSGLISLQGLSSDFDHALEEIILENLLWESP
jgi:hypothetical protein